MNIKNLLTSFLLVLSLASYAQIDCGCTIEIDPVCAQDSTGAYVLMPNECLADCWGYSIVPDSLCDSTGGGDCLCPQVYDPVCVSDGIGNYFEVPNACYAECLGFTVVTDTTLCDIPSSDCGCPTTDPLEFVCAQDSLGNIYTVPNVCLAECWGLNVVDEDCGSNPWEGCDCAIEEDEPFICAVDSIGHACYVPNACFAECWGLTIVGDSLCSVIDIDSEIDFEIIGCLDSLAIDENTTFQQALLLLSTSCGLELPECILNAPIFETDSAFVMYIFENCDDLGFNGNSEGSNIMNLYNSLQANSLSAVKDLNDDVTGFEVLNNPVTQSIQFSVGLKNASNPIIRISDVNGTAVMTDTYQLNAGNHVITKDISTLRPGMYFMSLSNGNAKVTTRKIVVIE